MGRFAPNSLDLDGKVILVTGGTGSFGRRFIETVLTRAKPRKLIVYSRDELKQHEMQIDLAEKFDPETTVPAVVGTVGNLARGILPGDKVTAAKTDRAFAETAAAVLFCSS